MNEAFNTAINTVMENAGTAGIKFLEANLKGIETFPLSFLTKFLTNKLTDHLTEKEFINRLEKTPPEKLKNQDILRVSKSVAKLALKATINEKETDNDTRKKLKKKIDEVWKQTKAPDVENEITVKDIYVSNLTETATIWTKLFPGELKKAYAIFKNEDFDKKYQRYCQIFFGEYLKEDHAAFVAYQREMQKLILDAINELKGENISKIIKESMAQCLKEIPSVAKNTVIQEEIKQEFQQLKEYFETKEIVVISKIDDQVHFEGYNSIKTDYQKIQKFFEGKYQFKYRGVTGNTYYVDELNEEFFDYLSGNIKVNQRFVKRIVEAIRNDCAMQHPIFYENIKKIGENWDALCCDNGLEFISKNFVGIIGQQLYKLIAIGQENSVENYVKKCLYIVERTIDLTIFAFLAQLWDDVHQQKFTLKNQNFLHEFFMTNQKMSEKIALLRCLTNIYKEQNSNSNMLFIDDVLDIADCFDEDGELYSVCIKLEKLSKTPTHLECYLAEKYLTIFCEHFRFLVNYHIASMKKIEYYNIKNINEGFLHHFVDTGYNSKKEIEKRNFDNCTATPNFLFTNAVLLYKGNDYQKNINLFPFVIDYHALKLEKKSKIAFFKQEDLNENELKYAYIDDNETLELEYSGIVQDKGNKNIVFLTDEDMKKYNEDCVFDSLHVIQDKLFEYN